MITDLATGAIFSPGLLRHDTVPHLELIWADVGLPRLDSDGNIIFGAGNLEQTLGHS